MEAFYTIQGEGFYQGHSAYFIRLAGCDVGCVWCDVKESWNAEDHPVMDVDDIVAEAIKFPGRLAVVTGGEPLIYNCGPLTKKLKEAGFQVNIETSGVHPASGEWDWVCFSPKKFKAPDPGIFQLADELKVVIYHPSDFKWAESFVDKLRPGTRLYLQPEWSNRDRILPLLIEYVKNNPKWRICVQVHKYLDIP
ncbi:7-carboxy-7-deazaguanine synthase [Fulvitalea axinellae]|uniref:7-carboxy-7-deazaguanine synthase n=1 Tax=Fulvitalea axinellae TaxID=1182444 RepID=A0AAU9D3K7_9BACT|nr:7-carboxy-7-deazaguanine synthase [Fulvitalea axinellae]